MLEIEVQDIACTLSNMPREDIEKLITFSREESASRLLEGETGVEKRSTGSGIGKCMDSFTFV